MLSGADAELRVSNDNRRAATGHNANQSAGVTEEDEFAAIKGSIHPKRDGQAPQESTPALESITHERQGQQPKSGKPGDEQQRALLPEPNRL